MSDNPELIPTGSEDPGSLFLTSSVHAFKLDDWWIITGRLVDLPADLPAVRPVGTENLLVCADRIRMNFTSGEQVVLNDWSDAIVVCKEFERHSGLHFRREKAVIDDSKERFRFVFFSETLESFPPEGGEFHLGLPADISWRLRHDNRPRVDFVETLIERAEQNNRGHLAYPRNLERVPPLPNSLLARLLVAAQRLIDEQRTEDADRFLTILDVILALDNGVPAWQELVPLSAATREVLQPQLPGSNRVPDLSPAVYGGVAEAYGPALRAFADQFRQFADQGADIEQRRLAAERILSKETDAIRFQNLVITQLAENLEQANANVSRAETSIAVQNRRVAEAEAEFNARLREWQRGQERRMAIAIAQAAFSFMSGIGKMLVGNPVGAAEAADAANAAAQAATTVGKLVQLMKKIAKIVEKVAKVLQLSRKLASAIRRFPNAKEFAANMAEVRREAESNLDDAPSDGAYWDQLWVEVETALAPAAGIKGAADYLKELKIMIIYGRALTAAQGAIPPIVQELARATLLSKLAEKQHAAVKREIEALRQNEPAPAMAGVNLWLDHRSVQRTMLSALQDFDAAHHYWGLNFAPARRDPINAYADVANDLLAVADLKLQFQKALESFRPRPQDFHRRGFTVPDTAVADLLRNGSFTLQFTPDFGPFRGWGDVGRVRVHEVAVWIIWNEGKRPEKGEVEFTIRTNGDYYDQRVVSGRIHTFRFTLDPVNLSFRYDPVVEGRNPDHRERSVIVSAKIAEDFRSFYTEPTLFTQWQFSLPGYGGGPAEAEQFRRNEDTIDLGALQGAVRGIRLEFSGKFIRDDNRFVEDEPEN